MTEELINDLQISARVPSRTSTALREDDRKSLPEIAKELGVDAIVEGSVSRSGSQVKITAQLIDASRDKHLWADSFQRDLKDVLALQSEVARAIAEKIRVRLTPEEATHLAASRPVDPEAYEAYLQGRYYWYRRTSADVLKARDYFEKAIAKDPEYALAYVGLADAYRLLGSAAYSALPPSETAPKQRPAAALDPMPAEAHASLRTYPCETPPRPGDTWRAIGLTQVRRTRVSPPPRSADSTRPLGNKIGRDLDPPARAEHERDFEVISLT
jgi:tetratricopeptide (TPR) repeat protein